MAKNRFLLQAGDYDLAYEFRVADLIRVERTIEDFWNEDEEVYEYLEYLNYLYMNGAFLTMEEANKIFNGLHEENEELRHKLSQQEMEYATDLHRLAEENEQLKQKADFYKYFQKDARELEKENNQLKMGINSLKLVVQNWEALDEEKDEQLDRQNQALQKLIKENEQLKDEIKGLNDILARYEEKELKEQTDHKEKNCGHCKHLQIDGMFGMWCEKKRNWTEVKYCEDFERDANDSYLF